MKILKSTVTKKVIVYFYNLGEKKLLKVAGFVIFPTSIMVLLEIHQRFKGHFLKELRVSFKKHTADLLFTCGTTVLEIVGNNKDIIEHL